MGNNLNPIKLIALGATETMLWNPANKASGKSQVMAWRVEDHLPVSVPKPCPK